MSPRSISSRLIAVALIATAGGATIFAEEKAAPSAAEAIAQEVRGVFEKCHKAVVKIEAADAHGELAGSGFFIDPNGTIITSYTIGGETRDIVVCMGAQKFPARRLVADQRSGVAILKIDAETPFLMPGSSRDLPVASPVVTIGYPMDLPLTPTFGTVGGFDVKYLGRYFATTHIRANVPVQRGEGGAPLLNMRGEVIGILISSLDSGSASFALPIEAAEKVRRDFLRFGEVRPGWLGLNVGSAQQPSAGSSAEIREIAPGSPAHIAGLEKGDILVQLGEKKIQAVEDVLDASFFATVGDELPVRIIREKEELELLIQPCEHPKAAHSQQSGMHTSLPGNPPGDLRAEGPLRIDR